MDSSRRATSRDVAERAGVSRTTVSYVLNSKSGGGIRISDATRERIWKAARELDYRPSRAAVALRTNRTQLLALMIPHIEAPYHPLLASAIQGEAERAGLDLIVYSTRDDRQRELGFIEGLLGHRVDGLIVQSYQLTSEDLDKLVSDSIAVVVFGTSPNHPNTDTVVFEETAAVLEVISHLVSRGHRRIATIAGPERTWCGAQRKAGYIAGLEQAGLPVERDLMAEGDFFDAASATRCMDRLLALPNPPTAIFCANDFVAVNAQLYAQDRGLSVPEDIAFVGFDDTPNATMVRPRLTTIRKSRSLQGETAVRLIQERIEAKNSPAARRITLPYQLVVRESS